MAPRIVLGPVNSTVTETDSATFFCRVYGLPRPSIAWLYVGSSGLEMLNCSGSEESTCNYVIEETSEGERNLTSVLTLTMALRSDAGQYACSSSNVVGTELASACLTVLCKSILHVYNTACFRSCCRSLIGSPPPCYASVAPTITLTPVNLTTIQPNNATFTCSADGLPRPSVRWLNGTTDLTQSVENVISDVISGEENVISTLVITAANPFDASEYTCEFMNEVDSNMSSAFLTVHGETDEYYILKVDFSVLSICGLLI